MRDLMANYLYYNLMVSNTNDLKEKHVSIKIVRGSFQIMARDFPLQINTKGIVDAD